MAIILNDNIQANLGKPIENKYLQPTLNRPYSGVSEVNSTIIEALRYSGLTVNVNGEEYWYAEGVQDGDLVVKSSAGGATNVTGATNGLNIVNKNVGLGGVLTDDTVVGGDSGIYNLTLGSVGDSLNNFTTIGDATGIIDFSTLNLNGDSANKQIVLDSTGIEVTLNNNDFRYAADYSGDFTPRSIVDKGYITGLTSSVNADIAYLSGQTDLKLFTSDFNTYSGATNTRITDNEDDITFLGTLSGTTQSALQTASNGLTATGTDVALGGTLSSNTTIDGDGNNLTLDTATLNLLGTTVNVSGITTSVIESNSNIATFDSTGVIITLNGSNTHRHAADYSANYVARSLVDKAYVDTVAAGLDPKESVRLATVAALTGATYTATGGTNGTGSFASADTAIDGITLANGNRVLVKNQADAKQNGIYVVISSGNWERSTDQDGSPANEVSAGNFTFVETGNTLTSTGWVVIGDGILTLNTDDIDWVQFNASSGFIAGDGIDISGTTISVDLAANSGLDFNTGALRVAPTIAGNGLDLTSGVLSADVENGLSISNGKVVLGGTLTGNTVVGGSFSMEFGTSGNELSSFGIDAGGAGTVTINSNNLKSSASNFGVTSSGTVSLASDGNTSIYAGAADLSLSAATITIGSNSVGFAGAEYVADYSADFTLRSLVDKGYVTGLTSANISTANNGLTKTGANITLGGALTGDTTISGVFALSLGDGMDSLASISANTSNIYLATPRFRVIDPSITFDLDGMNQTAYLNADSIRIHTDGTGEMYFDATGSTGGIRIKASGGNQIDLGLDSNINITASALGTDVNIYGNEDSYLVAGNGAYVSGATATFRGYGGMDTTEITIDGTMSDAFLTSNASNFKGFRYGADYSADYVSRSLVDKDYVDNQVSGNSTPLNVYNITGITSATLTTNEYAVMVQTSGSTQTVTLPAAPVNGQAYKIKDRGNALTNTITISGNGKNIDGSSTASINTDYGALELVYSSAADEWFSLAFIN